METYLGKIRDVKLGTGGYQDAMFGFSFDLGGDGFGCSDFWGTWSIRPKDAEWSIADQQSIFAGSMMKVKNLMADAKVESFSELKNKPIKIIFKDGILNSWSILTEVL